MWWGMHGGQMGAGGWIGMGFMIVFWIAVVVGIVYLIRYLVARPSGGQWQERLPYGQPPATPAQPGTTPAQPGTTPAQPGSDALSILEQRYAKGEIDREEFLQRKADLTS